MCDEVRLANLLSVNTWCFLCWATCIRSSVNDIRALFNIQTFRNRVHIASCDCVQYADDSVLYCCRVGSFSIRLLCELLKRVQRLRIWYRSVELYLLVVKADFIVVRDVVTHAPGVSSWLGMGGCFVPTRRA